ncbi:MAG: hypothetical protein HY315_10890 [Acidobacteria bacterium]|nr:hypothetical protein [Acidobacteriota bacterium]
MGLQSSSDVVSFSVFRYNGGDDLIRSEEVTGSPGDNYWDWCLKSLRFTTDKNATAVRIRFGLVSSAENYLDVDSVN